MKKDYQKPMVDKINFCYRDQVVAASSAETQTKCTVTWINERDSDCSLREWANDTY